MPLDIVRNYGRKPIYLKLGATYCIPCRLQMPEFERFCEANGDRMQIVAVNAGVGDDPAKVRACVAAAKLRMPVAIDDGTLGSWLQMEATPFHVLIGLDGRIAHVGYRDGPGLDAAIQRALTSAPRSARIETAQVQPIAALKRDDVVPALDLRGADDQSVRFKSMSPSRSTRKAGSEGRPRAVLFTAVWCESYLKDTEPQTATPSPGHTSQPFESRPYTRSTDLSSSIGKTYVDSLPKYRSLLLDHSTFTITSLLNVDTASTTPITTSPSLQTSLAVCSYYY